jgi:AcrR family transcriptional regulator
MTTPRGQDTRTRVPLTRERVLLGAVELADRDGIASLTMRNLAHEVGVEAMSLYYHVANKEAVLDGLVEVVVGEINEALSSVDEPKARDDWKSTMRRRILTAREVMLAHSWAPDVIEQRTSMSPAILLYFEGLLGIFREGGFSYDLAHHAMHALGSKALGFSQELFKPGNEAGGEATDEMLEQLASQLPHLTGMLMEISHDDPDSTLGWCDDQAEFRFSLDLLLDGLELLGRAD